MSGPTRHLFAGTNDGVYRAPVADVAAVERVLESGPVLRVRRFGGDVYAATCTGLFRSGDAGETWTDLGVPRREVYSVAVSPDGEQLYAGTHPAHLYVSRDGGGSWRELESLQELPSRGAWHTPRHRGEAHVRSLAVHLGVPDRVVAGVEVGGVHVSDDRGASWTERRDGLEDDRTDDLQYDVHHLLMVGEDEFVVSCGCGLYRTRDAGASWTRLDAGDHTYFRESLVHAGRLYAAATRGPGTGGNDAALFEADAESATLEAVPYPGAGEEFVLAWTVLGDGGRGGAGSGAGEHGSSGEDENADDGPDAGGDVLAGTNAGGLLRRVDGEWTVAGRVPARIRSLTVA